MVIFALDKLKLCLLHPKGMCYCELNESKLMNSTRKVLTLYFEANDDVYICMCGTARSLIRKKGRWCMVPQPIMISDGLKINAF